MKLVYDPSDDGRTQTTQGEPTGAAAGCALAAAFLLPLALLLWATAIRAAFGRW